MTETEPADVQPPRWPVVAGQDPRRHGHRANGACPPACRRRQGACPWPDTCGCDHSRCFAGWVDTTRVRAGVGYDVTAPCPRCRPAQHVASDFDEPTVMCPEADHRWEPVPCRLCAAERKAAG